MAHTLTLQGIKFTFNHDKVLTATMTLLARAKKLHPLLVGVRLMSQHKGGKLALLISFKAKNCFLFNEEIELSMKADKHYKSFPFNVATIDDISVLKSVIILGPNNAGKTKLTDCIGALQGIMLNQSPIGLQSNLFETSPISELAVNFLVSGHAYTFEVHYNTLSDEFVYERFSVTVPGKEARDIFLRDTQKNEYRCPEDPELERMLPSISKDNILIYLLDPSRFAVLRNARKVIRDFALKIDVVDMGHLSLKPTIDLMKNPASAGKVKEFVINADLSMDDFQFNEEAPFVREVLHEATKGPATEADSVVKINKDILSLTSVYRGRAVPSIIYDSRGTLSIEAIAAYVISALEDGRILVIDELDNSLHFRLTRAIVALFNNESNKTAQLIATTRDPTLLDCKKMFRKEQIWFAHKDEDGSYLYSLADFSSRDGVRSNADIFGKYKKGVFGAIPDPDLFPLLLELEMGHGE